MNNSRRGITFIEILVTISIIGILGSITAISFANSQKKARDEKKINDLQKIKVALEVYRSDNTDHLYPPASASFPPSCGNDWTIGDTSYIKPFPCDNNTKYIYAASSDLTRYSLRACLNDTQNTFKDQINNNDPNEPDILTQPSHMCPGDTVSYTQRQP